MGSCEAVRGLLPTKWDHAVSVLVVEVPSPFPHCPWLLCGRAVRTPGRGFCDDLKVFQAQVLGVASATPVPFPFELDLPVVACLVPAQVPTVGLAFGALPPRP